MIVTRQDLRQGLHALGVRPGMVLMVHSSLSALGRVEGGADTVIEALLEAVGPEGTLLMPAMGSAPVFKVDETPSGVGTITDAFWRRPEVTRSLHPTHSVAGQGPLVEQLLAGHLDQPTAIGPESPWGRVAQLENGYILLLGCDQDRNTLLHTAEEIVNGAYLNTIERDYLDPEGQVHTKVLERFPGPHRDFIQLDRLFQQAGALALGRIGQAQCRLMKASEILRLAVEALQRDPAAVLCDNPHCLDCVSQRAAIKRDRLAAETFRLSAVFDEVFPCERLEQPLWEIAAEGISVLELGVVCCRSLQDNGPEASRHLAAEFAERGFEVVVCPAEIDWQQDPAADLQDALEFSAPFGPQCLKLSPWLVPDARLAETLPLAVTVLQSLAEQAAAAGVTLLLENHPAALWRSRDLCGTVLAEVAHPALKLAFNPAHFAHAGEHPFLSTWNRGKLKRHTIQLMLADGCGRSGWPAYTEPGRGQGEVKELVSILRCRSFSGLLTLSASPEVAFPEAAAAFWRLLDTM